MGQQVENTAVDTMILNVLATDDDQTGTSNAAVTYSILEGDTNVFRIDSDTGEIFNRIMLVSDLKFCCR